MHFNAKTRSTSGTLNSYWNHLNLNKCTSPHFSLPDKPKQTVLNVAIPIAGISAQKTVLYSHSLPLSVALFVAARCSKAACWWEGCVRRWFHRTLRAALRIYAARGVSHVGLTLSRDWGWGRRKSLQSGRKAVVAEAPRSRSGAAQR